MGNKNNRGQAPIKLAQQKALTRQQAFDFDYTTFPKHLALSIKNNRATGDVTLPINLDIAHHGITAKDPNFLNVLPRYANLITKVEIRILAPSYHESREIYFGRVENMMKTIDCLNKFNIEEFHFVVCINKADNFQQIKLAATAFGLDFKNWTMATKVRGVAGTWKVDTESE